MRTVLVLLVSFFLVGCERGEYGESDDNILCSATTSKAFYARSNAGQTSFIKRSPQFDFMCQKQIKQGEQK